MLDAIGGVTKYTYTSGGGCTSCGSSGDLLGTVTDAKNQTTTFNYDKHQRLTSVVNPVGNTKTFEYDEKKNLTKVTDAKGQVITFDYDVKDRLIKKHLPEGDVIYTYDGADNLLSVTSPDSAISMSYGILNQVIETKQTVGGITYTIDYTYDVNQNRTQMSTPWGTTNYTYDNLNRLVSITNPDNKTITFAYDALGRRTKMTYPNGIETTYAYDAASQLTQILARKTADNSVIAYNNYSYDNAGNRTQMQDLTGTHTYAYDDLYRLITAEHPATSALPTKTETFTYDKVGNRTSDAVMTNYQYNTANRLLENSSYTYTYDANGNRASQTEKATNKTTNFAYTSENQLKQVTLPNSSVVTFKYDPLGRRIEKTTPDGAIRYIYDSEDIITTLDGNNIEKQIFTHGPGIDEPLALKNINNSSIYFYHADCLGSITALSNESGEIVEAYEYKAYGEPIIKNLTGAVFDRSLVGNFYLFTAREYDHETGLYYLRARYLIPSNGRFIQEDPAHYAGLDLNLYSYALSNPINLIDPDGRKLIYTGSAGERALIWWAIFKLRWNSPAARKIIDILEKSSSLIIITISQQNAYSPKANTCQFNPNTKYIYQGSESWNFRPSEIGLLHELIHALHDINGQINPVTEEDVTVGVMPNNYIASENEVRGDYQIPRRPRY